MLLTRLSFRLFYLNLLTSHTMARQVLYSLISSANRDIKLSREYDLLFNIFTSPSAASFPGWSVDRVKEKIRKKKRKKSFEGWKYWLKALRREDAFSGRDKHKEQLYFLAEESEQFTTGRNN